ncbi:MAG: L,D-transpeptidase [Ahrensia sp.]|nr:L,D-transpeptidase [Ahrensia sp.]
MKTFLKFGLAFVVAAMGFGGAAYAAKKEGEWYRDVTSGELRQHRVNRRTGYASNRSPIRKRVVSIENKYRPGTIIVDTSERRLYYVMKRGRAMKYGIGVGRDGFQWTGTHRISRKAEWPGWTPPKRMIARVKRETGKTLKGFYPGGPNNPLGARALYIGSTIYRIHGTNQPWTIGQAMSSGCIRLANDDVEDLYARVKIGSRVIVRH